MNFIYIVLAIAFTTPFLSEGDFIKEQLKYNRVRSALADKGKYLSSELIKLDIDKNEMNILMVAYKKEQILKLYIKNSNDKAYRLFKNYDICKSSGVLGPKIREGDLQAPEGFYYIDRFNPESNFHLSLGINYPNKADLIRNGSNDQGGDIFIHGACVTVGCLPLTDDKIKELYLLAIQARQNGQLRIPVYIFPFEMNESNYRNYTKSVDNEVKYFWSHIKKGHDLFESSKSELSFSINENGDYNFK